MAYLGSREWFFEIAKGNVAGHSFVHKFGYNPSVSTSLEPVTSAAVYPTPTSAVSLEVVSSDSADALNGAGAHEVTIEGLDATGAMQVVSTATHATDGTTAVNVTGSWLRVFRAYVSSSGSYATASGPSHVGTITIRVQSAGATYAEIPIFDSFPIGQSLIGAYTVPLGYTAYMLSQAYTTDVAGTKTTDFLFFKRENILDTTSSYSGVMRVQNLAAGIQNAKDFHHDTYETYPALTDIGFMAYASTTSKVSCEFELLLVEDGY